MNPGLVQSLRTDLPRKLVALFFAVLLWLFVRTQLREVETVPGIPLELEYNPTAVAVEHGYTTVDLEMRGAKDAFRKVDPDDILVKVPITSIPSGQRFMDVPITPDNVVAPYGLKAVRITPDRIQVSVDRIVTRPDVPIRVRTQGDLRDGFILSKMALFPKTVTLNGPSQIVGDVPEIQTEPIVLDEGLTSGFEIDAPLVRPPRVNLSSKSVHVAVYITRNTISRPFGEVPVHILAQTGTSLYPIEPPPSVNVTLNGPVVVLDTMESPSSLRAFVDLTGVTSPMTGRFPVQVWAEGGANLVVESVFPPLVQLTLKERPAAPVASAPDGPESLPAPTRSGAPTGPASPTSTSVPPTTPRVRPGAPRDIPAEGPPVPTPENGTP